MEESLCREIANRVGVATRDAANRVGNATRETVNRVRQRFQRARPAIPCATASNTNIHNKISKVLTKSAADAEYAEYAKIAKADPKKKCYLGKPQKCLMSKNDYNAYVKNSGCRILKPNTSEKDYKMLQYLDGGSDLDDFVKIHLNQFLSRNKQKHTDLFWLNAHVLFMGLKAFAKKDILHDDLKPQNIVFKFDLAKDTMEFNFIDFGLMQNLTSIVTRIQNGSKIRLIIIMVPVWMILCF